MSIYFYPTVPNKYVYFQEVYMLAYKIIKTLLDIQLDTYNFPSALIGIPLIFYYHHLFFFLFFFLEKYYHHLNRTAIHIKDQHVVFYT